MLAMLVAACADGATITVRKDGAGDYSIIQQALDAAAAGDTILIGPGEYLEHSAVRFPAWSHDIESYANVTVDDLTIIGAGSDLTFIGPTTYSGDPVTSSPKAITYLEGGEIRLQDLCLRNCRTGAFVHGRLFIDHSALFDNYINVWWEAVGSGGWIRDSQFDVVTPNYPISIDIINSGGAGNIAIADCTVNHSEVLIDGIGGAAFRDCTFSNYVGALEIYGTAIVSLSRCVMRDISIIGIVMAMGTGAVCNLEDCTVLGGQRALAQDQVGGAFHITNSRLEGGYVATVTLNGWSAACSIHNSDLIKGSGLAVRCDESTPRVNHDFRNNYWGTADEATIQSWITDHSDDAAIGATILYSPFAGQSVPAESTSWGSLKALWR